MRNVSFGKRNIPTRAGEKTFSRRSFVGLAGTSAALLAAPRIVAAQTYQPRNLAKSVTVE